MPEIFAGNYSRNRRWEGLSSGIWLHIYFETNTTIRARIKWTIFCFQLKLYSLIHTFTYLFGSILVSSYQFITFKCILLSNECTTVNCHTLKPLIHSSGRVSITMRLPLGIDISQIDDGQLIIEARVVCSLMVFCVGIEIWQLFKSFRKQDIKKKRFSV